MNSIDSRLQPAQSTVWVYDNLAGTSLQIKSIKDIVCATILSKPKESRHFVRNMTTDYLDKLEAEWNKSVELLESLSQLLESNNDSIIKDEYISKIGEDIYALNWELDKLNKIIVLDNEHISIAGFVHRLWVHNQETDNPKAWVVNFNWNTHYNYKAALNVSKQFTGYKLYTHKELEILIDAIPWYPLWNHIQIFLDLLQIPLSWVYSHEETRIENENKVVHLWTSTKVREHWEELYTKCIIDQDEFEYPEFEVDEAANFSLLIFHKDKRKH